MQRWGLRREKKKTYAPQRCNDKVGPEKSLRTRSQCSPHFCDFFGRETEVQHGRGWQIRQGKNSVGDGGKLFV